MASNDVYNLLNPLLDECMGYFKDDDSTIAKSFVQSLKSIHKNALHVRPIAVELIAKVAHRYDASPDVKANGYRSLLALLESLLHMIVGHLQSICKERKNIFFRANQYSDKLRGLAQILHQMRALFGYSQLLIGHSEDGTLFVAEQESDDIMHDCEIMAKSCFYSHAQGFQYYPGIQPIIQALSMFTASYNDISQHTSVWKSTKSLINSGKYVVSPSVRGRKIEKIYSEADATFFKAFFSLPDMGIAVMLPSLVGETVRVNRVFNLLTKPFELDTLDGDKVTVKRTSFMGSEVPVKARLISNVLREGQDSPESPSLPDGGLDKSKVFLKQKPKPKSNTLLFFCHGGGFISLTTKSYEMILREWSKELDCPIFAVDYSLAPEAPFPEAFEECFYAYAWALKHAEYLGTTAEKVIFAGDSAGGNLVLSVAMRAAAYDIKRPDGLLVMYPSCVVRYSASPSRLLAVMDPLLPHCMLSACLCAYTGFRTEKVAYNQEQQTLCLPAESSTSHCNLESPCHVSPSKQTVVDNSIITTFLQDVGEGLGRLATPSTSSGQGSSDSWWDDELFTYEISDNNANLKRRVSAASDAGDPNEAHFKVKLSNGFMPLKSKYFGERTKVHHTALVKNPYISPALAPDDMLRTLPSIDIVGCELDPLFDDSVTLARRLYGISHDYNFHVVRGLPHGFLSLQVCKETKEASKMCLELLRNKIAAFREGSSV